MLFATCVTFLFFFAFAVRHFCSCRKICPVLLLVWLLSFFIGITLRLLIIFGSLLWQYVAIVTTGRNSTVFLGVTVNKLVFLLLILLLLYLLFFIIPRDAPRLHALWDSLL